jgi:uncharacterized repeat protein (TIGR03803 family)
MVRSALAGSTVGVALVLLASAAMARESVIYDFPANSAPQARLDQDNAGNLYGTTYSGGQGNGTVFQLSERRGAWKEKTIDSFTGTNGRFPIAGVTGDPDGVVWGTTEIGGKHNFGVVFSLAPAGTGWTETVVHSFSGGTDGRQPMGNLMRDSASGNFYGTAAFGGAKNCGVIFQVTPPTTETTLYAFQGGSDGCAPQSALHDGPKNGTFVGVTHYGGNSNAGTLFVLAPVNGGWKETVLYTFTGAADGGYPIDIGVDKSGNILGVAASGGAYGQGAVFELSLALGHWTESVLHSFRNAFGDGAFPVGIQLQKSTGVIFVATAQGGSQNLGTVLELTPNGNSWSETILHSFGRGLDGAMPMSRITMDATTGAIYGTTSAGGQSNGGTVYTIPQ